MTTTIPAILVKPKAALQLAGRRPEDYATPGGLPRSDMLFSAICQAWALLGLKEPLNILENEPDRQGIWLSSAFPYVKEKSETRFLWPRPMLRIAQQADERAAAKAPQTLVKKAKKIKWLDVEYFQGALRGEHFDLADPKSEYLLNGEFFAPSEPYRSDEVTRAAVQITEDKEIAETTPFTVGKLWFAEDSGFYFLYQTENEDWLRWLKSAVDLLQHEGLGTDRNVGYGHFEYYTQNIPIATPSPTGYWLSLGLYLPQSADALRTTLSDPNTRWSLVKRGGWITSEGLQTYRKRSLYFFEEGSVFYWPETITEEILRTGARANIAPTDTPNPIPHPIWRSGQTLFFPVNLI